MRIGDLAARTGASVRALRYYEEQHLLAPERSHSGQRHYQDDAVERVRLVQLLLGAGMSSKSIRHIMPCVDTGVATPDMLELLAAKRELIDRQIAELVETRERLDKIIVSAGEHPRHEC